MENIFVTKYNQLKWKKHSKERISSGASPDVIWSYLVDSSKNESHGISVGCLQIPVGAELPLHTHRPQEIYFVKQGNGVLLKANGKEDVEESDVIYIPKGEKHGLLNNGPKVLEVIWIFPTDSWEDVEYNYIRN